MTNRILTDAEMDRLELKFGSTLPVEKSTEMTVAQKIATAVVLFWAVLVIFY